MLTQTVQYREVWNWQQNYIFFLYFYFCTMFTFVLCLFLPMYVYMYLSFFPQHTVSHQLCLLPSQSSTSANKPLSTPPALPSFPIDQTLNTGLCPLDETLPTTPAGTCFVYLICYMLLKCFLVRRLHVQCICVCVLYNQPTFYFIIICFVIKQLQNQILIPVMKSKMYLLAWSTLTFNPALSNHLWKHLLVRCLPLSCQIVF